MSDEVEARNIASWQSVEKFLDNFSRPSRAPWRTMAQRFLDEGKKVNLNRYFRAGTSAERIIFSTLDNNHGLKGWPRVTVEFFPENDIRIGYGADQFTHSQKLEYVLPHESAFPTFRRFLNQLWIETSNEPLPDELRGFEAPVLTRSAL